MRVYMYMYVFSLLIYNPIEDDLILLWHTFFIYPSPSVLRTSLQQVKVVSIGGFEWIFINLLKSAAEFSLQTSGNNIKANEWPLKGAMYINLHGKIFGGIPKIKMLVFGNFLKILMVSDKMIHGAFRIQ